MSNVLQKMLDSGYIKPEDLEKVGERVADFMEELQSDPELFDEALQKLGIDASLFDALSGAVKRAPKEVPFGKAVSQGLRKALPLTLAATASTAAVAGASGLAQEAYRSIRNSLGKAKAYKNMIDNSGDRLEGIPSEKVQESFNTLYKFNPDFAQDPAIAAEFIRETSRSEAYPFQLLRMVSEARPESEGKPAWLEYKQLVPGMKLGE